MSLLGKDQETVIEALKTLSENGERLKVTESELEEVKNEVEDLKDENRQKVKKIRDLKDDLQYESNLNEDLESDLKKAEKQVDIFKHGIENKDCIIEGLDKILKEKDVEVNKLKETVAIEEKKGVIQKNVIKELKDKFNEKVEVIKHNEKEELDHLVQEIKQLEATNKEKERILENVEIEKEKLKVKLEKLESINENLSLGDELNKDIVKTFSCEECGKSFDKRSDMKTHIEILHEKTHPVNEKNLWKAKLKETEIQIYEQKLELSSGLFSLKEKEINLNKICRCRGFCRIRHEEHNWTKSKASEIYEALQKLAEPKATGAIKKNYSCNQCESNFVRLVQLKCHMKTNHKTSTAV